MIPDIFDRRVLQPGTDAASLAALERAQGMACSELQALIEASGLEGKGGGGFPVYRKLALLNDQSAAARHLVVNGGEHEPGSAKDRYLLEHHAVTVLEGALILAHAAGAGTVHIAIPQDEQAALAAMRQALQGWQALQALHAGTHTGLPEVRIATVPASYIVGEESALLEALQGREPLPRQRPPHPVQQGLDGQPTLIQNVETVAHLPYIVSHGAPGYRSLGAGQGVTLCTFGPEFVHPGVRLVPVGIPLRELLTEYGGGLRSGKPVKAVQPGGPSSAFLSADQLEVRFSRAGLREAGSAMGCGVIRAYDQDQDMAAVASQLMDFFADSSCGQCPGCRMQTQMLARIMRQVLAGQGSGKLTRQIPVLIKANAQKGVCGFIHMPGPPVLSVLEKYAPDLERYYGAADAAPAQQTPKAEDTQPAVCAQRPPAQEDERPSGDREGALLGR